jgi:flagellar basal-body rod modification protein FlgD
MAQLAGWIGMEARSTAPVGFSGAPITILSEPATIADQAALIIRDSAGAELQRQQIPTTAQPLQWAGVTDDGVPFPTGQYSFAVESYANGESLGVKAAATYAQVTETRQENGEIRVVLSGGPTVSASEVTALRAPQSGL